MRLSVHRFSRETWNQSECVCHSLTYEYGRKWSSQLVSPRSAGVRDKRASTLWRDQRGIGITAAWLYPVRYTSGFPSRRDRTTIAQRFSVGSRARIDQVPKGRLKFIPISSRKTCFSFSRPFGTLSMLDSPPNVENVGLFSAVP